jgi:thymidylate synthase (FAD)
MQAKLVSLTQSVVEGVNSAEELIVYIARVSNPSNQLNMLTSDKLLGYCIRHKHWSPFEMASMTVEIKTSRAIAAQILRHRSFSFQEFSQRYAAVGFDDAEAVNWRLQGKTNRQVGDEPVELDIELQAEVDNTLEACRKVYHKLLDKGVAKECARMVLPLATSTTLYMQGNVRSWIHYLEIRTAPDTQQEHRQVAEEIKNIFKKEFPIVANALEW